MNLNFPFIFPERTKHFYIKTLLRHLIAQDAFKASYSSRHFYFGPVRHFSIARHTYRRLVIWFIPKPKKPKIENKYPTRFSFSQFTEYKI